MRNEYAGLFLLHYVNYMSKLSSSDYGTITWVRSYHILLHYKIDDYEAITCVKSQHALLYDKTVVIYVFMLTL